MFSIDQIKEAHARVKSGADFPAYIQDLIQLGVTQYTTYVNDGHTEFSGNNDYQVVSPAKYETIEVAAISDVNDFKQHLKDHQQGQTNYITFCQQAAATGVEKWIVIMQKMTCTYYNKAGEPLLQEEIPIVSQPVR
jgi:uncharacterized protein YbcV (DUF1398 family)